MNLASSIPAPLFAVADAARKKPVGHLEDYLGARGHCVIVRQGAQEYIHAHPMDDMPMASGKMAHGGKHAMSNRENKSHVIFHATFRKPGLYKVWGQMKRQGEVFIADFVPLTRNYLCKCSTFMFRGES